MAGSDHPLPVQVFTVDLETKERYIVKLDKVYPYILVNVGSGISILKAFPSPPLALASTHHLPFHPRRGSTGQWAVAWTRAQKSIFSRDLTSPTIPSGIPSGLSVQRDCPGPCAPSGQRFGLDPQPSLWNTVADPRIVAGVNYWAG